MRPSRLALAAIFALVGLVWIGQGVGAIGGSAMSGSPFWAVVGAILVVVAVAIVVLERRRAGG
jgi:glucose dehydrogenase